MKVKFLLLNLFYFYLTAYSQIYTDKQIKKLADEFFYYVKRGELKQLKEFFTDEKNFPADLPDRNGYTALQFAVAKKDSNLVNFLLIKGANHGLEYPVVRQKVTIDSFNEFDAPIVDSVDVMALAILACKSVEDTNFIKFLWNKLYKDKVWYDKDGNTLLHYAMFSDPAVNSHFLGFIIRTCKIHPNALNTKGQNAFLYFISQPPTFKYSSGEDAYCNSPINLYYAALDVGINVEATDNSGKNYLSYFKDFNVEHYIDSFNLEKEYKRVYALLKKFRETDHEEMQRRNDEAFQKHLEELKEYQSRLMSYSSSESCNEKCPACFGFGSGEQKAYKDVCPECNGRGNLGYSKSVLSGYNHDYTYLTPNTCWRCNGTGVRIVYEDQPCSYCNGTGCLYSK